MSLRSCSMLSLLRVSVLALCISMVGEDETGVDDGTNGTVGEAVAGSVTGGSVRDGWDEGKSRRCRSHIPVPGMLTFWYTPLGPTLTLNGDAPSVALSPRAVRFSLTPGNTRKVLRKRQLIRMPHYPSNSVPLSECLCVREGPHQRLLCAIAVRRNVRSAIERTGQASPEGGPE